MFETLIIANIASSLFMAGLIWFIQLVQYPAFAKVDQANFLPYHRFHISRTGYVVIPPMLIELGTSIWLTLGFDALWSLNAIGLALVISVWLSTFGLQVPLHQKLQTSSSPELIARLVSSNWLRTTLWSAKAALSVYLIDLL